MRVLILAGVLVVLGALGWYSKYVEEARGELRCEGAGLSSSMLRVRTTP
jgi:hypothetical protein